MKISDIILILLFIISIATAAWYLFGDSPTLEGSLLIAMLTILVANIINTRDIKTRLTILERSFHSLASDVKNHLYKK